MRTSIIAAIAALCFGTSSAAIAATTEYPTADQSAKCKTVNFERADVGASKQKFTITFKDGDLAAIKACNQSAEIDSTPNGVRVVVQYADSGAVVMLPIDMKAGNAHTARCVPDTTGSIADTVLYKAVWADGLPEKATLAKVDKAFFDSAKALETCKQLSAASKVH